MILSFTQTLQVWEKPGVFWAEIEGASRVLLHFEALDRSPSIARAAAQLAHQFRLEVDGENTGKPYEKGEIWGYLHFWKHPMWKFGETNSLGHHFY